MLNIKNPYETVIPAIRFGLCIPSSPCGPNVCIIENNFHYDKLDVPIYQQEKTSKGIDIGDNVWIGSGCAILDGATIRSGAIITPNSVVSSKIPENAIAQGNPAKVIFTRR